MVKFKNFFRNLKNDIKDILASMFNSFRLFRLRKKNGWIAFGSLFIIVGLVLVPVGISYVNNKDYQVIENLPNLNEALHKIFSDEEYKLNCKIENEELTCNEDSLVQKPISVIKKINNVDVAYTYYLIIKNNDDFSKVEPNYNLINEQENYIFFGKKNFEARYIIRDHSKSEISSRVITGNYKNVGDFDFSKIFDEVNLLTNENDKAVYLNVITYGLTSAINESNKKSQMIQELIASIILIIFSILLGAYLLRGGFFTRNKERFTWKESLKLSCFLPWQSLVLSFIGYLIFLNSGIDFLLFFGIFLYVRMFFIYFKYLNPNKISFSELLLKADTIAVEDDKVIDVVAKENTNEEVSKDNLDKKNK